MKLLDRINRADTTVLMATHDSTIVDQMRKRVIELDDGGTGPRPEPGCVRVPVTDRVRGTTPSDPPRRADTPGARPCGCPLLTDEEV